MNYCSYICRYNHIKQSAMKNLFDTQGLSTNEEQFDNLLENSHLKLERIVSFGHLTPIGEWYDQEETEWVVLLKGTATLLYKDGFIVEMKEGDALMIPPHVQHRVEQVSEEAVWLALFIK